MQTKKIIVVGAGPAGIMAAIRAKESGQEVMLLEKKSTLGNKLLISGKGRCNLTNACSLDEFLKRFSKNAEFLRDAFKKFFNQELMDFFQSRGLKLKIERQERVFPITDRSSSILQILQNELHKLKVEVRVNCEVTNILLNVDRSVKGVSLKDGTVLKCQKLILATGGASYSFTGSDGTGLKISKDLGHEIVPFKPGLVPLEVTGNYIKNIEGLTLKNISLKFSDSRKEITSEVGELLFTSFGISGPLVMSLSGKVIDWLDEKKKVYVLVDLKPGLTFEQLDSRLLRELKLNSKKSIKNVFKELLPLRLVNLFMQLAEVSGEKKSNQLTAEERQKIVALLKGWRLNILRSRKLEEGIISRGGVSLKEINPRSMVSRKVKGLYFCGELIDVDADTGGFNLQAAFSTGYLAGESAAKETRDSD